MSAASAAPTLTSLPERAFSLHCAGLRSPAIAQQLGVPERTVRSWIARIRDDVADEHTALLRDEFIRAVEHLHQLSAAAWQAFEDEQAQAHSPASTPHPENLPVGAASAAQPSLPPVGALPAAPAPASHNSILRHSPRYLRLALDAQRHLSRLFGHFDNLRASSLDLTDALTPVFTPTPDTETKIPAKTATASAVPPQSSAFRPSTPAPAGFPHSPASGGHSAQPIGRSGTVCGRDSLRPAESAIGAADAATAIPAKTAMPPSSSMEARALRVAPHIPAKTAISPVLSQAFKPTTPAPAVYGHDSSIPAKTATFPPRPGTTPAFPASVPIHWRM